jgi:PAS domain-containing protein
VEEELSWKSAFMDALANSAMDGIIVVDPQGRKILQNQRAAASSRYPGTLQMTPMTLFKSSGSWR